MNRVENEQKCDLMISRYVPNHQWPYWTAWLIYIYRYTFFDNSQIYHVIHYCDMYIDRCTDLQIISEKQLK